MTIASGYSIRFDKFDPTDPRLGRHVRHDSRSLLYKAPEAPSYAGLISARHVSRIPTLDQLNIGRCTGNAGTKAMTYGDFWLVMAGLLSTTDAIKDEAYADKLYSDATKIDGAPGTYPPTDTGSDGLSIAKVLHGRGLISGYQHVTTLLALLTVLQKQPTISGSNWLGDMFTPGSDGRLSVTGNVEGGHEYVYDEIDVTNRRVWIQNSWNSDWGINGRAWMTWDDAESLLMADGDATPFVPINQPAPTPTPAPTPAPAPTPQPAPTPGDPQATWVVAAQRWTNLPHSSKDNIAFDKATTAYLAWLAQK